MKKILLCVGIALGLMACGPISEEERLETESALPDDQTQVTASAMIDVLPYFVPNCGAAGPKYYTQKSLRRWFIPKGPDGSGRKQFMYVKNDTGADYESMTADASWIRLWKDTSWAYLSGGVYCDEQCGSAGVPTNCKHQYAESAPQGYAYQAPKDTGDWQGAKLMPRYIDPAIITTVSVNLLIDAQRETGSGACGDCASWHEGTGGQTYTIQHLASYTNPATGNPFSNVIKKVITSGIGAGEVYFYAKGVGWVGYEVPSAGYQDWITTSGANVANPVNCTNGTPASIC